jgi:tetratricopeptide (TPR) repeat protein
MSRNIIVSALCIILFSFCVPTAEAAAFDDYMSKGRALLEEKKYHEAAGEFRKALIENRESREAQLQLGIALSRSGSGDAEGHLKKALSMDPADPQTNLELGIYYHNRRINAEAIDYFENVRDLAPGTEYSSRAEEHLRELSGATKERPWSLGISLGEQYDSNVLINSDSNPLPEGISRKSDWKSIIYLDGRLKFIQADRLEASLGYSLYQTLNYSLSDFNIMQNLADVSFTYKILPSLSIGGMYKFEYILVGGDHYDTAHYFGPVATISEGKGFFTKLMYVYRYTTFKNSDLFTDNSGRSGPNNSIGASQSVPLCGNIGAEIGYSFDKDLAREDFWRYEGNKGYASLNARLPLKFFLNLYGEYYKKKYEGINPFSGTGARRRDEVQTYSISATRFLTDRISVSLGETYIHNDSNVDAFRYDRSLTTLLVNVRF